MAHSAWTRVRFACALALVAALLLALAAPAGAVTRKQASKRALAALGSKDAGGAVIVFGLKKSLRSGTPITQGFAKKGARPVMKVGRERAFFYYEDSGPFQPYPHAGRIALVNARTGKVRLSKGLDWPPRIKGLLPIFLKNAKVYRSPEYQVYFRTTNADAQDPNAPGTPGQNNGNGNAAPKANNQDVTVKQDRPRNITLTGTDDDGDFIVFVVTKLPSHGTLSGAPPDVTYTPDPGYLGADDFNFRTFDDVSQSNNARVNIQVVPLGLPPTVVTSAGCTAYNARAAAVAVDSVVTTADPDDAQLAGATVRVAANFERGDDLLFTDQNGIIGSYDDITGVLTLSGTASVANYQAALRTVRYRNLSVGNPAPTKDIAFTVNDGGSDSAPATKQVCITPGGPNRRPIGEVTSEGGLNYTENDGPVPVDASFVAVDPDSPTLSGATIKFAPSEGSTDEETGGGGGGGTIFNFFPGEDRLAFTDQNGITGSYDSVNGVLTLSGSASVADYQTALQSVTYENTSEDPSDATRTIRFQITDGDGATSVPSSRDVYVTPVNDAPVVTPSDGTASYTEGDPATVIDSTLTAGDVDNTTLSGAQVSISSGFQSGDDLVYVDQSGISGVYNTGTGVLTLTGTASVAAYKTALQSISFRGTSDDPPATKTIEYVVNDGELDSAAATRDIAVTPVNDAPSLTTTASTLSYAENAGPVAVDPGVTASDPDSPTFAGGTVQITGNYDSSQDVLAFTDQNGISGTYDSETGTLILSGSASPADYQSALQSVTYENTSDNPSTATRTVTFQVDDGGAENNLSNSPTRDISVTPSNDAPTVTTSDGSSTYTTGSSGAAVDSGVVASDVDDANLEGATVRITGDFQPGDALVFVDQAGVSGVYDTSTGVLTLTGQASVEDYQAALQSIEFTTTAESPGTSRTVEFVVNDGEADSNAATKTIDITTPPPNDPPVVTTTVDPTLYGNGDPAVTADSGVTVTDANDTNLESARVRISAGADGSETLSFTEQNGIEPSYDPENGILTLTGTATVEQYQAALQSVTFQTSGDGLEGPRTIEFIVNDGDADSNAATKAITVGPPTL